jgi:hypothetical protein
VIRTCSTNRKLNAYRIWVEKIEENIPLGRLTCEWEGNIKIDLEEVG